MAFTIIGVRAGALSTRAFCTATTPGRILSRNKEHSVAAIDLDLALGDPAGCRLDIIQDYTSQDDAENISRLDYSPSSGPGSSTRAAASLLPRPIHMEERPPVTPDQLQRVIAAPQG